MKTLEKVLDHRSMRNYIQRALELAEKLGDGPTSTALSLARHYSVQSKSQGSAI